MLLMGKVEKVEWSKANCAGFGCEDRAGCRRYQVRIGEEWRRGTGLWASFDVERLLMGECKSFVRWHGDRVVG